MSPSFTLESVLIAKGDSFCSSRQMGRSLRFCGSAGQPAWIASLFIASLQRCAKLVYPGDGYRISGISRSWFAERTAFLFSALWHWLRSHSSSWHFSAYLLDSWVLYFEQKRKQRGIKNEKTYTICEKETSSHVHASRCGHQAISDTFAFLTQTHCSPALLTILFSIYCTDYLSLRGSSWNRLCLHWLHSILPQRLWVGVTTMSWQKF